MGDMQVGAADDVALDLVHVAALGSGVQTHIRLTAMSTRDIQRRKNGIGSIPRCISVWPAACVTDIKARDAC